MAAALVLLPLGASAQVPQSISPPRSAFGASAGITVFASAQQRVAVHTLTFTAIARGNADEAAVIAAMRAAGIDDPSVGANGYMASNQTVLRGTVRDVSRAKLEHVSAAAADYMRAHPGTSIDNIIFTAPLVDCPALEQTVRGKALAEARRRAEAIAIATSVGLGPVAAVAENGGCPTVVGDGAAGVPVDPVSLTAMLNISETVTYAIVPPDAAARRKPL